MNLWITTFMCLLVQFWPLLEQRRAREKDETSCWEIRFCAGLVSINFVRRLMKAVRCLRKNNEHDIHHGEGSWMKDTFSGISGGLTIHVSLIGVLSKRQLWHSAESHHIFHLYPILVTCKHLHCRCITLQKVL